MIEHPKTTIEIVDSTATSDSPALIPNEVWINGKKVLLTEDGFTLNGLDGEGGEFLSVTMTIIASRIVFRGSREEN